MYDEMDTEFAQLVDELKHEIGCIATFLPRDAIQKILNAAKTTGPALTGDRYDTLAVDALSTGNRATAIGFLLIAECTEAIEDEARALEGGEEETGYHPVDRPLFGRKRQG